ncbi:uncharacterized protein DFL_000780 [Arthrobotrys flagrans]|uniref:Inhibitor I9 domain-containing protein n=1 Tax=Arthrobotrys flagrans TaxID=97331 RepID=A0A437AFI2_ARTFL|nr:hypothetical protein DFL_000780 [Arthrobotrys flagrans]
MPISYIITVKEGGNKDEVKQHAIDSGARITHDYTIINAFAAEFPDGAITTFENHPHVEGVEVDGVVTTQ